MSNALDDLDKLAVALDRFGGRKTVKPELPAEDEPKLANLRATKRPFMAETPELAAKIVTAVRGELKAGRIDGETWDRVAADAVKQHVVERFELQGGDITLEALKPSTVQRKARAGLDPRIGIARPSSGLLHNLKTAPWRIVRRG